MKKIIYCLFATALISACSNEPVKEPASATDNTSWDWSKMKDTSVSPGDDYFMYCLGKWYNQDRPASIYDETEEYVAEVAEQVDNEVPVLKTFQTYQDLNDLDRNKHDAQIWYDTTVDQYLMLPDEKVALWKKMAELYKEGFPTLFYLDVVPWEGYNFVIPMPESAIAGFFDEGDEDSYEAYFIRLGNDKALAKHKAQRVVEIRKKIKQLHAKKTNVDYLMKHSEEFSNRMLAYHRVASRAGEPDIYEIIGKELGIAPDFIVDQYMVFELLNQLPVEDLKTYLQAQLATYEIYLSKEKYLELAKDTDGKTIPVQDYLSFVKQYYLNYTISVNIAKKLVPADWKSKVVTMTNNIKEALKERINRLDWMTQTSKTAALEKADKMILNVAYPDKIYQEGIPQLRGQFLLEDIHIMEKTRNNFTLMFAGKKSRDYAFEMCFALDWDYNLAQVNAFYFPYINSINIYPAMMVAPNADATYSDAYNYGRLGMVIGHEMTHAFDMSGSRFDSNGAFKNWWTLSDRMDFEAKAKKLVTTYGLLPLGPESDLFTDGEKTLNENIADIGGVVTALDAYTKLLEQNGFRGDERMKQEKKFFEGFANGWRVKYSDAVLRYLLEKDEHATPYARVNGAVINIDRWYELYNVKWGDMLYIKPEVRTTVW